MLTLCRMILGAVADLFRPRAALEAEPSGRVSDILFIVRSPLIVVYAEQLKQLNRLCGTFLCFRSISALG